MGTVKQKIKDIIFSRDTKTIVAVLVVELFIYMFAMKKGFGEEFKPFTLLLMGLTIVSLVVVQKCKADRYLLIFVLTLMDFGFLVQQVELGSNFYTKSNTMKLFLAIVFTLALSIFYSKLMPKLSEKKAIYFMMGLQIFISVAMVACGTVVGDMNKQGASISMFGITPFEIVKVLQIFVCAGLFEMAQTKNSISMNSKIHPELIIAFHTAALSVCMIFASELGSLMVIMAITAVGYLVYGSNRKVIRNVFILSIILLIALTLVLTNVVYPMLVKGTIMNLPGVLSKFTRICTSLHPEYMADTIGYQGTLGLEGIAMGGKLGLEVERLRVRIPEAESDFIFADLVQSCGLIIGIIVIIFLLALMVRGIQISINCENAYLSKCALLTTMLFTFEAVYHIGYNLSLVPISGIPLYFLSKSFLAIMTGMNLIAILLFISTGRENAKKSQDEFIEKIMNRTRKVYLTFGLLFASEIGFLFYNSGVVPGICQRADNLKVYAAASMDEKTSLPGNIYDCNGNVLVENTSYKYLVENEETGQSYVKTEKDTIYVDAPLYCQVVGYTGNNNYDILASSADKVILGRNDYRLISYLGSPVYDKYGIYTSASEDGTNRHNTTLTLDAGLQNAVFDALSKEMSETGSKGSAVVLDAKTGRVLAMVSFPTYDTNDKDKMMEDMKLAEENGLEPRFPVSHKNAKTPGSIFKVFVAVALIDHGMEDFTVKNEDISIDGWTCKASGYWSSTLQVELEDEIDLETALEISSNTYFSQAALALGKDRLMETAKKFMLYPDTFVDENGDGVDDGDDTYLTLDFGSVEYNWDLNVSDGVLAQTGFGQGRTELSTVYAAMMMQGIANYGVMLKPYMIDSIRTDEGEVCYEGQTEILSRATSMETAAKVIEMMRATAVECCSGHGLDELQPIFDQYEIAGKTGTAENGDAKMTNNAWYMSLAPASNPQYVVVVNQCETNKYGYEMMDVVADIYTYLFEEYNQ